MGAANTNGAGIATDPTLTGGGLHEEVLYAQRVATAFKAFAPNAAALSPGARAGAGLSLAQMSSVAGLHRSKRFVRDW